HDYHELTYMRSGKANFLIDGRPVSIEKGATLVIRPNTSHQIQIQNGPAEMLVLYFGFSKQTNRTNKESDRPIWSKEIAPQTLEQFIDFAFGNETNEADNTTDPYLLLGGKSRQD